MKNSINKLSAGLLLAGLLLAATAPATAQEYTFTTLAGPGESPGALDGPGSAARFYGPSGVAVDSAGNVYVADWYNYTIRKVAPGGVVTTLAGLARSAGSTDGTGSAAGFYEPAGVAVDSAGNVYVADRWNSTIRKVTPGGVVTTLAGLAGSAGSADGTGSAARFYYPQGVAVDSAGNVYVADTLGDTIRKVTPGGVVSTLAGWPQNRGSADGTGSAAQFERPYGVTVDSAGNVYVADTENSTIRKVTPGGVVTTLAGQAASYGSTDGTGSAARFYQPYGVAVDGAGNVYVADTHNYTIRKVTPGGAVTTLAGLAGGAGSADGTGGAARFHQIYGVAVDVAGNVYVADGWKCTIRKVTPGGVVTTLAGLAGSFGSADGTGSAARFSYPHGVAVDSAGTVYVADTVNNTVRKVTPGGVVTTLAGLAGSSGTNNGTGSAARFRGPSGVAVDGAGNVYVADDGNQTIRKVTPGGGVTTLAGQAQSPGSTDGTGSATRFKSPHAVAVGSAGTAYVADRGNNTIRIRLVACPDAPTIDLAVGPVGQPRQLDTSPQTAVAWQWRLIRIPTGSSATLSATNVRNPTFTPDVADLYVFRLHAAAADGALSIRTIAFTAVWPPPAIVRQPLTQTAEIGSAAGFRVWLTNAAPGTVCQWYFNGTPLAGATNTSLKLADAQAALIGTYTVVVSNAYGAVTSAPALLNVITAVPRRTVAAVYLAGDLGSLLHLDYTGTVAPTPAWQTLASLTLTNAPQLWLDLTDPMPAARFYRVWQAGTPSVLPAADLELATELTLTGTPGTNRRVDYINRYGPIDAWVTLATVPLTSASQTYVDLTMFRQPPRLYRLVPVP